MPGQPVLAQQLWFTAPQQVELREQALAPPQAGEVLVQTECSAPSAGTELLVYRGQLPGGMALDASIASLQAAPSYPLHYGYACVGRIRQVGPGVAAERVGERVFAFEPHASHFITRAEATIAVPEGVPRKLRCCSPIWRRRSIWCRMPSRAWASAWWCWGRAWWVCC